MNVNMLTGRDMVFKEAKNYIENNMSTLFYIKESLCVKFKHQAISKLGILLWNEVLNIKKESPYFDELFLDISNLIKYQAFLKDEWN